MNVGLSIIICLLCAFLSIFTKLDFVSESTDQYKLKVRIAQTKMPVKYIADFTCIINTIGSQCYIIGTRVLFTL